MFRQIWQRILNLWRQIQRRFRKQPAPPPPQPTQIWTSEECEQKFLELLEGVAGGWSRGEIKGFLIGSKIKDAEWENWLQEFGERLLVSPENHLELGRRMVRLGEMNCGRISEVAGNIGRQLLAMNCGRISEVAGNIGRQLLAGEGLNQKDGDNSYVVSESTDNSDAVNQSDSTSQSESIEREVSQEVEELFDRGVKRCYAGDIEGAIALYEKALEIDPKYHEAWNGLGNALNGFGHYSEAKAAFEKVLEIDPKSHIPWNGLGNALNNLGRYSEAKAAFEKVLEIDPNSNPALYGLGATLHGFGRYSEAKAAFEKALEIDPKYHHAWNGLGATLNNLGRYSEAKAACDKALEIDPKYHNAWNGLGNALKNLGRNREAIAAFEKALEITGDQLRQPWENRGWAFFNSGRYSEAIQNWDEGLQKYHPSNHDYRLACGKLHQSKGRAHYIHGKQTATYFDSFHKAKASYEQAREFLKSPLIPETYLEVMQGLITVCRSLGDPKTSEYLTEATTVLETLLLDNQTHPEIKLRLQRKFAGLDQLEVDILVESGDKVNALEKAESRKNFCLQWMRATSQNRIASPTYYQIQELLANNTATAIIYWHLSPVFLTTFIITLEKFEVISTPLCDLFPRDNSQSLEIWLKNWKTNYQSYCETGKKPSKQQSEQPSKESHPWRQSMTAQLPQLADILKIPQICAHLTNIQNLILIPHRDLHLLPLDALFLPPFCPDSVTDSEKPKIRRITRLPSAQIAIEQQQQKPTEIGTNSLVIIGKTDYEYPPIEAAAITQINQTHRASNATTKTAIIQALKASSSVFHYTGHAYHNTEKSEASALMLSKNEELTLTDILQLKFVNYYLVCLSACETGITKKGDLIDEFVGISSGFLPETNYVISTLWRAEERSSALLMIYFYQLWKQGIQPPFALQQAKDWLRQLTNGKLGEWYGGELLPLLRNAEFDNKVDILYSCGIDASILQENLATIDEKPYEHPYYWAAFNITGNG